MHLELCTRSRDNSEIFTMQILLLKNVLSMRVFLSLTGRVPTTLQALLPHNGKGYIFTSILHRFTQISPTLFLFCDRIVTSPYIIAFPVFLSPLYAGFVYVFLLFYFFLFSSILVSEMCLLALSVPYALVFQPTQPSSSSFFFVKTPGFKCDS